MRRAREPITLHRVISDTNNTVVNILRKMKIHVIRDYILVGVGFGVIYHSGLIRSVESVGAFLELLFSERNSKFFTFHLRNII